jgi:hypothetical protein
MLPKIRAFIPVMLAAIFALLLVAPSRTFAQRAATPGPTELRISGAVSTPLVLTADDLKKMPRKTLSVVNPHEKKKKIYEGVLLAELYTLG